MQKALAVPVGEQSDTRDETATTCGELRPSEVEDGRSEVSSIRLIDVVNIAARAENVPGNLAAAPPRHPGLTRLVKLSAIRVGRDLLVEVEPRARRAEIESRPVPRVTIVPRITVVVPTVVPRIRITVPIVRSVVRAIVRPVKTAVVTAAPPAAAPLSVGGVCERHAADHQRRSRR